MTVQKQIAQPVIRHLAGQIATVSSSEPLPPGSRVFMELRPKEGGAPRPVSGKIVTVKRSEDEFTLTVRLNSLSREDRVLLTSLIRPE